MCQVSQFLTDEEVGVKKQLLHVFRSPSNGPNVDLPFAKFFFFVFATPY